MSQAQNDWFDPSVWPKDVKLFPWVPTPPSIPERHPYQRWFKTQDDELSVAGLFTVYRSGRLDVADVGICHRDGPARVNAEGSLKPEHLRQLAELLLTAADDIETWPAEKLAPLIKEQEQRIAEQPAKPVEKVVVPWED